MRGFYLALPTTMMSMPVCNFLGEFPVQITFSNTTSLDYNRVCSNSMVILMCHHLHLQGLCGVLLHVVERRACLEPVDLVVVEGVVQRDLV